MQSQDYQTLGSVSTDQHGATRWQITESSQAVFNAVCANLARQGKRSFGLLPTGALFKSSGSTGCLYRGPDGCRCSIGGIMPDPVYQVAMEGRGVYAICTEYAHMEQQIAQLLERLQDAHDIAPNATQLRAHLQAIALHFSLTPDAAAAITSWEL